MKSIILTLLFTIPLFINAQQYGFINYSQEEGLSQSQVRAMHLDSRGYLWIGTVGGLSRYDGEKFKNYSKFTGMLDDHVNVIHDLNDGRIAVGTVGGISIFSNNGFENIALPNSYASNLVSDFIAVNDSTMLIATLDGVFLHKKNTDIHLTENIQKRRSHSIVTDKNNEILISIGNSIYRFNDDQLEMMAILPNEKSTITEMILHDNELLVLTNNSGIQVLENETFRPFISDLFDDINSFQCLHSSNQNTLWMGSNEGVYCIENGEVKVYRTENGLQSNQITCIESDSLGNVWFGTDASGFIQFTSSNILTYTESEGLGSNLVMCIERIGSELYIGTYDFGVSVLGNSVFDSMLGTGKDQLRVWDIEEIEDNRVLFATEEGLILFDADNNQFEQISSGLNSKRLKCIYTDYDGRIWIGNNRGVNIIENDSLYTFDFPDSLGITKTREIAQDLNGVYWFATRQGLISYSEGNFSIYNSENGLKDESAYCLEPEYASNRMWVGTRNGLHYIENGKPVFVQIGDESQSNHINFLQIVPGNPDILVIGTNFGVYTAKTDELVKGSRDFVHIARSEGLPGLEMNQNTVFLDKNNDVWVGSTSGVSSIRNLQKMLDRDQEPPVIHLQNVRLNLEEVNWSRYGQNLDILTGLPSNVEVNYKENHLSFSYQGISYNNASDLQYEYILEGYDNKWQPVTTDKIAVYSNLPYQSFVFKVRTKYKNSDWSLPVSFAFSIKPPFWRTWWFYTLSALSLFTAVYLIYLRRKRILLTELEKEKYEFRSKMLALEQQSLNSSMNRHFIFNSLNSIQYYINRKDRLSANKYLSSFARLIRKNLDSSQTNTTKLSEELERLELYIELEQMRFQNKFDFELNVEEGVNTDDVNVPSMLLQPFLENSIWHGLLPKNELGKIKLNIEEENDNLLITIQDNGIGVQTSMKRKEGSLNHDSKGMNITRGRIELIRKMAKSSIDLTGPEELKNEDGETIGTEVRIKLPNNLKEIYPR